jgi:O-antigen/teichoic acid export membrane protein
VKRLLVKNSVFGLVQAIINLLLVFFVIPVFIHILGSESYGVFALVMIIGNLNTFTNLGLTSALVKFIAEQGKSEESDIDILVNLILMIAAILPLTIIVLYFDKFILLNLLKIPLKIFVEAKWLYFWLLWANVLLLVGQVFKSVLDALQKVYITSLQQVIYNLLYWGLILISLLLGFNLPEIGLAIFISAFVWLIITLISVLKEWGKISYYGLNKNFKNAAKKQLNYGLKIYASGMIGFFYEPLSKILISNFIGVTEVGFYDIALKIRGQLWGFIAKIFYPLFPFISEQKDHSIVRKYVHDLEQKTFLIVVPIIAIVILLMYPFIVIWLGKDVDIISITAAVIISFHLIGSSTVIPNYQFLMAKNLAQKTIILQLSNVVFNALFFLVSVYFLGYYALIVGNVVAIISSFILSLYYQKKYLDSLIFDSLSQVIKLISSFIILVLIGFFLKVFLDGNNIVILIIVPVVIAPITLLLYKIFGLVKLEDIYRYFGKNSQVSNFMARIYSS